MGSPSEALKHHAEREAAIRMFQGGETVEYIQKYVHLDVEELERIKMAVRPEAGEGKIVGEKIIS